MSLIIWAAISKVAAAPLGVFALCIGCYGECLRESFQLTLILPLQVCVNILFTPPILCYKIAKEIPKVSILIISDIGYII